MSVASLIVAGAAVGSGLCGSDLGGASRRPGTGLAPGRITGRGHRRPRLYRAGNLAPHHWALNIPGVWGQSPPAFGRFKAVDQVLEVAHEVWVVEVRLVAGERDDAAVAFDGLAVIAFGLMEPAKAFVAVMHAGEARQQVMRGLLGGVEFSGVDQGEDSIGRVVQFLIAVLAEVRVLVRRGGNPRIGGGERLTSRRRVIGHTAALVFLAAAAGAEIIPSDFGHLANVSSKDGSLVPSRAGRRQVL